MTGQDPVAESIAATEQAVTVRRQAQDDLREHARKLTRRRWRRFPWRIVRADRLDELTTVEAHIETFQAAADDSLLQAVRLAGVLFELQVTEQLRARAQERVHQLADHAQVLILRRSLAVELLDEIDTTQLPPEAAEQIRIAVDALVRGGEVVNA